MNDRVTLSKVILVAIFICLFFGGPIFIGSAIQQQNEYIRQQEQITRDLQDQSQGRVAGLTTTAAENGDNSSVPIFGHPLNINQNSILLMIPGILLLFIALTLILYLFTLQSKAHKKFKY